MMPVIGRAHRRAEGLEKVTGATRYTEDLRFPGMLHARLLVSPYPKAQITHLGREAALKIPAVVAVLAAPDLARQGSAARELLAYGETAYTGHPVAVVLAESESAAADGLDALQTATAFRQLPAVLTIDEALREGAPLVRESIKSEESDAQAHSTVAVAVEKAEHPSNIANRVSFSRGDAERGLQQAEVIVRRTYTTSRVHHGYIEPQATVAAVDPITGDLTVYTPTQDQFWVRTQTAKTLGLDEAHVRVIPMTVGGGFGGKILLFQPLVGALALLLQRPIRLVHTRSEDFATTKPAPATRTELELGATKDGELIALRARMSFDAGCLPGSPLTMAGLMMGGYYRVPNLAIEVMEILTNKPPSSPYRAPGAPQATFAIESAMSELAGKLGIDPVRFRLRHASGPGDPMPHGQPWVKIGLRQVLEVLDKHPLRHQPKGEGEGLGMAIGGWFGGLEPASACVRANKDGTFEVIVGSVDISGTATTLGLIAAETLGVGPEKLRARTADTSQAPYAGGSSGSKITYTVGTAVRLAAEDARRQILSIAGDRLEARVEDLEIADGHVRVKGTPTVGLSLAEITALSMQFGGRYPPVFGVGSTAITRHSPGFAGNLVRVRVDRETGHLTILDFAAVQDVGFAINPPAVEGQMIGGATQGIGWALYEQIIYDDGGGMMTGTFADYAIPRAPDVPRIDTIMVEVPSDEGPFGAKGVGEPPVIPGAAAIANAIADAIGVRCTALPLSAGKIVASMREHGERGARADVTGAPSILKRHVVESTGEANP